MKGVTVVYVCCLWYMFGFGLWFLSSTMWRHDKYMTERSNRECFEYRLPNLKRLPPLLPSCEYSPQVQSMRYIIPKQNHWNCRRTSTIRDHSYSYTLAHKKTTPLPSRRPHSLCSVWHPTWLVAAAPPPPTMERHCHHLNNNNNNQRSNENDVLRSDGVPSMVNEVVFLEAAAASHRHYRSTPCWCCYLWAS